MLQKNRRFIVLLNMLAEAALIFAAYHLSLFFRFTLMNGEENLITQSASTEILIFFYSLGSVTLFYFFHLYIPVHQLKLGRELGLLMILNLLAILILGTLLYILRLEDFSRVLLILFWLSSTVILCVKRISWHEMAKRRFREGVGLQHVILIGSGETAESFVNNLHDYPQYGRCVIGYIGSDSTADLGQYFGPLDELESILETAPCDEVVVALEPHEVEYISAVLDAVGKEGLRVSMIPFYHRYFPSHPTIETVGHAVMIDLRATPMDNLALSFIKRAFDVVASLLLILLFSPLMLITAIGVRLGSPGPILFRQKRVGLNKEEFTILKFRSMRVNTEEKTGWSTGADPRRTAFGRFIRKYSIDELPQLFNVLKGEMSLVGPRPELPHFVYRFKESVPLYLVRQQVRPGMTGWAQIHGLRGDTSIEERVNYDIWYIENWSPMLDLRILLKTLMGGFINREELENGDEADRTEKKEQATPV